MTDRRPTRRRDRRTTRRRALLGGGAALLAGLAGCTTDALPGGGDPDATTTAGPTNASSTATADPNTTTPGQNTTTAAPTTTAEPVTPRDNGAVHLHGTIRLVVDGTVYRFGDEPWNMEKRTGNPHFHFHDDGSAVRWHVHSRDVSLGYAVEAMPAFDLTATSVTYHGHTYRQEWPGTSVEVTVNDAPLESPRSYMLAEGDAVVVTVETDRPTPTPTTTGTGGGNATGGNSTTG